MCRIFCSPDRDMTFDKKDLWEYLFRLEKALGKDGNGIYNFTTKELWKFHNRMPTEANIKGGILFHTRYATNGLVRDYNCQPFDNERYVLVHNGMFSAIEGYARLLGFPFSTKKYSDTYMMAWVMEKVGILNWYNAFKDKYYGVVIVLDKKTDKLYLLKTGGSFEYGMFDDDTHIYGSASLDFWGLKDKAVSMNNGLFIISGKGFTQLDSIRTTYISTSTPYYGRGYGYGDFGMEVKTTRRQKKKEKIKKIVAEINKETVNKLIKHKDDDEDDDDIPLGMAKLFPTLIPKECHGCNWIYKRKCWFGGTEHENPVDVRNPDTKAMICNTKTSTLDVLIECSDCNTPLGKDIKWGIVDGIIKCEECEKSSYYEDKQCHECEHYRLPSGKEPCVSCYNDEAIPLNWEAIKIDYLCNGCYYEEVDKKEYPCKVCEKRVDGMTEWTTKNGTHEEGQVCDDCGSKFDDFDTPEEDKNGCLICAECRYEEDKYGDETEEDFWAKQYDYYKNGKWRYG